MSDLSVIENNLVLTLDNARANNRRLHNFLKRIRFVQRPEGFLSSNLDYFTINRVRVWFEGMSWPLTLDRTCEQIITNFENEQATFQSRLDRALEIKNTPTPIGAQLTIPGFSPDVEFEQFQIMPIMHAHSLGSAANFAVPGGGKTWMAYADYFLFRNDPEPENVEKLLVICPLNAFTAWEEEYTNVTGDENRNNIVRLYPASERDRILQNPNRYEIFLINYESLRNAEVRDELINNLIGRGIDRTRFLIILDESHKIKNYSSQQSEGVRTISTHAHRRLILTGTPMPTRWQDLWNQFNFLFPNSNLLESYSTYEARIDIPTFEQEIRTRLQPAWTRVTKAQLGLPESPPQFVPVVMSEIQTIIYETVAIQLLTDQHRRPWMNALSEYSGFIWLIEVATDPALLRKNNDFTSQLFSSDGASVDELIDDYNRFEHPGKLEAIEKLLEEDWFSGNGGKVIIWANFLSTMSKIENMCNELGYETRKVNGTVSLPDRETNLRDFRFDVPDCNILIANPATLSESISLHMECHRAIYVDRTYNPAHWMQSRERIHRINMPENARYYVLLSEFPQGGITIDHLIRDRLEENEERMNGFLDSPELNVHGLDVRYDEDEYRNSAGNPFDHGADLTDFERLMQHLREKTSR